MRKKSLIKTLFFANEYLSAEEIGRVRLTSRYFTQSNLVALEKILSTFSCSLRLNASCHSLVIVSDYRLMTFAFCLQTINSVFKVKAYTFTTNTLPPFCVETNHFTRLTQIARSE